MEYIGAISGGYASYLTPRDCVLIGLGLAFIVIGWFIAQFHYRGGR